MIDKKDCCTWFPEKFRGDDIHLCCCQHDEDVTHTYSPITPAINFWNNLGNAGVHKQWRLMIVTGATIGVLIRYPYFIYLVYQNHKRSKHGKNS